MKRGVHCTGKARSKKKIKANEWWGKLCKFRANKYEVIRGIWKTIAVPSLLYGMDTINWSVEETNVLEIIQNKMGLGANKMVGMEAIRGDMGWSTFEERLFKEKLIFKIRLEKMDEDRWAKKCYQEVCTRNRWRMN